MLWWPRVTIDCVEAMTTAVSEAVRYTCTSLLELQFVVLKSEIKVGISMTLLLMFSSFVRTLVNVLMVVKARTRGTRLATGRSCRYGVGPVWWLFGCK